MSRTALSPLRLSSDVEALAFGDDVFVRGVCESETIPPVVRTLPGTLYIALPDDQLIEYQCQTPTARIPIGHWVPLQQWLDVELPVAALEANPPAPISLDMRRSTQFCGESNLLLAHADVWLQYAELAPDTRLRQLRFTCKLPPQPQDSVVTEPLRPQQVLIHGAPLPPIVGERWVEQHGVAAPSGWTWTPAIDSDVLQNAFRLEPGDVLLLFPDGSSQRINRDQWSPAHRSAVRLSLSIDAGESNSEN